MIRDYTSKDTDDITSIWKAASEVAHPFLAADFLEQEADNLRNIYLVHAQTKVLEVDGQAVGFIAMIGNVIGGLFLAPKMHGLGHGSELVDDAARSLGGLEVDVFERNTVGRRFYNRYGFRQTGSSTHEATGESLLHLLYRPSAEGETV